MSYEPKLAAALSGAPLRQLSHWRRASGAKGAPLVPEISASRPIPYSFRDVVALRARVKLRGVSAAAARGAVDLSDYVDSYVDGTRQAVACGCRSTRTFPGPWRRSCALPCPGTSFFLPLNGSFFLPLNGFL